LGIAPASPGYSESLAEDEKAALLGRLGIAAKGHTYRNDQIDDWLAERDTKIEDLEKIVAKERQAASDADQWRDRIHGGRRLARGPRDDQRSIGGGIGRGRRPLSDGPDRPPDAARLQAEMQSVAERGVRSLLKTAKTEAGKVWAKEMAERLGIETAKPKRTRGSRLRIARP
jgi:hypothetical protein